jgi:hypothetical protein
MFELARQWGYIEETAPNPASRIQMNAEVKRSRYLSADEAILFAAALKEEPNLYTRWTWT